MTVTHETLSEQLAALPRLTLPQLRDRYAEAFGEAARTNNKTWLLRRLAWRLQMLAEGGLSERARRRAAELADDAEVRLMPPRVRATPAAEPAAVATLVLPPRGDERLPPPGTVLTRPYKGSDVQVLVLASGFEYAGQVYPSLSAVARAVTGSHCNGFLFFRVGQYRRDA
jgi:hypothetical protein